MEMSGNTVLITGGATGIGFALAEHFLKAKNEVVICSRRNEKLAEAKNRHPEFHIKTCDVAEDRDRRELVDWVTREYPKLNILVNNAGIQRDIDFTKGAEDFLSGESEIEINLEAPIVLTGMLIPFLTGKPAAAVINVTSGLGFIPAARMPVYSATKAGLHAFSMALRHQLQKTGVKVFEVVPPAVDTDLNPKGRAARGNFKAGLLPDAYVASVMNGIRNDVFEIGYGMTEGALKASRAELDAMFRQMNSRW